jgi:hypothetical protein
VSSGAPEGWAVPAPLVIPVMLLSDLLFVAHCLSFCPFSFDHCIICPSVCRSLFVLLAFFLWPLYYLSF